MLQTDHVNQQQKSQTECRWYLIFINSRKNVVCI